MKSSLDKQLIEVSMTKYGLALSITTTYKDMLNRIKKFKTSKGMDFENKEHLYNSLKSRLDKNKDRFINDPNDAYLNYDDTKSYCQDCLNLVALDATLYKSSVSLLSPPRSNPIYETKIVDR